MRADMLQEPFILGEGCHLIGLFAGIFLSGCLKRGIGSNAARMITENPYRVHRFFGIRLFYVRVVFVRWHSVHIPGNPRIK